MSVFGHWNFPGPSQGLYEYFSTARQLLEGNTFGYQFLAHCYLDGLGTAQDYQEAYRLAWETKDKPRSLYVLRPHYCEGLGMPQDIAMGVEFLDRSGLRCKRAKHYKKSSLGGGTGELTPS